MNVNFVDVQFAGNTVPLTIIPLEVHWSRRTKSNGFCKDTWEKALKRIEKDPNCRVVFVGDIRDVDRPSTRERKALAYLGRPEALDEDDMKDMDELDNHLIPQLKRIKDKIIGAVDGDHFVVYGNGQTSTQYMMNKLGIPNAYLGERMGWIRIHFRKDIKKKSDSCSFDIFVRHGKSAASNFGCDVNKLVTQSVGFDAHLYIGGHTHRQWFVKVPYLYCGRFDIRQRFVGYARAGSLLRGFLYGQTTYAELCEYSPLSIGWPEIYVYAKRTNENNLNLTIADIKGLT